MAQDILRGRFVWHELMTTDTGAAAAFYKKVVGWKTQDWPHGAGYTLFVAGKQPIGGLMTLPEAAKAGGAPPNWMSYIGTSDVDATSTRLVALGGKILRAAWDIPTVGRVAIVQDPQGAVFGLYKPLEVMPPSDHPALGEFSWHELATDDQAGAFAFYQDLFGWQKTSSMDMGPEMGSYDMFGWNGVPVGGIFRRPPNVPSHWLPYAMVADSKKAGKTIVALGAKIVNGPMEVPGGDWIVAGIDPQGAAFAVHSLRPAAPVKKAAASRARKGGAKKVGPKKAARAAATKRPAAKAKGAKAAGRSVKRTKRAPVRRAAKKQAVKRGKARRATKRKARR